VDSTISASAGQAAKPSGSEDNVANMVEDIADVFRQYSDFGETAAKNRAKSRIDELLNSGRRTSDQVERVQALLFVLRQPTQTFDLEYVFQRNTR
jgi:hypothetical protein